MATSDKRLRKISDLVSNPVFLSPQMAVQEGAETSSQILYANRFSGIDEVPMTGELLDIFTSNDINLTDTNFRLQLQHLLEEFDSENGPWYIEGQNGVIHIHNRKVAKSGFVYRYQDENGEVLKVTITTNWTTGSSSGTVASTISKNKVRDLTRLDIPALDFSTVPDPLIASRHRPLVYWQPQDNTRVAGTEHIYESTFIDNEGRVIDTEVTSDAWRASQALNIGAKQRVLPTAQDEMFEEQVKIQQTTARHKKMLPKGTDLQTSKNWLESRVADPSAAAEEFDRKFLEEALKSRVKKEKAEEMLRVINKVKNQEVLSPYEQQLANTRIWVDDPELKAKLGGVSDVRKFVMTGQRSAPTGYGTYGGGVSFSPVGKPGTVVSALTIDELSAKLVKAGVGTRSHSNTGLGGSHTNLSAPHEILETVRKTMADGRKSGAMTSGNITVRILDDGKYEVSVSMVGDNMSPVFSVMDAGNYLRKRETPGVGGSKRARALAMVNRMRNRAKKAKHKEIEVQMVVIGRPSLRAGQYLDILNIGQKYSGQWYVKTCIHQMDSNGYTCSLTLKRNQTTPNGTAVGVTRKKDGSTSGQLYQVNTSLGIIELTANDLAYANELALQDKSVSFGNFVRTAIWAQQQGTYGEGLKTVTNAGDIHMNGQENPDLQFADTPNGKAVTEAYNAEIQKRKAEAKKASLQAKIKSKIKK